MIRHAQPEDQDSLWRILEPVIRAGETYPLMGLSTIVDFERSRRVVPEPTVETIHRALEKAGVEFIDPNDGGPGVGYKCSPHFLGRSVHFLPPVENGSPA
jgi:hypothetical protein